MLKRDEKKELQLDYIELAVLLDDLFEQCNSKEEVEWVEDIMLFNVGTIAKIKKEKYI
jgi:hypothetical protein